MQKSETNRFEISSVGVYTMPEQRRQTNAGGWLLVNLGKFESVSAKMPSGREVFAYADDEPFAFWLPRGGWFNFDYRAHRENWVIHLPADAIREVDTASVALDWPGLQMVVPALTPLDLPQTQQTRLHLKRMLEAFHDPEQGAQTRLRLSLYALLDCILNRDVPRERDDPAEALRKRIIGDRRFAMHLSELSDACGYSADHIRRLFEARYGLTPKAFRTQYRMHLAQELLELRGISVREVAGELGYSHPAHFSSAFKAYVGESPHAWKQAHQPK